MINHQHQNLCDLSAAVDKILHSFFYRETLKIYLPLLTFTQVFESPLHHTPQFEYMVLIDNKEWLRGQNDHGCNLFMMWNGDWLSYLISFNFSGTSSVAVAWSGTFDELIGGHILDFFKKNIPINAEGLAPYPDFFAVGLILILSGSTPQCLPLTSFHVDYLQPTVSHVLCLPTKAFWRSESRSQRQSTRSSRGSTSWCFCS